MVYFIHLGFLQSVIKSIIWTEIEIYVLETFKLPTVQLEVSVSNIYGPFFVEKTVTGMLELFLKPKFLHDTEVAGILFQRAPPRRHCRVTSFLEATFPNKWICSDGPIRWPLWFEVLTA